MPVQDGLRFGNRRQVIGWNKPLNRYRAQVGDEQIIAPFQNLCELRRKPVSKTRDADVVHVSLRLS